MGGHPAVAFFQAPVVQVDPVVSAAVHNVSALFAKARQDFSGYYRAALQYLCYVSLEDLREDECIALARDISLAALLGDSIFSFADLLLHPVVRYFPGLSF
jgi:26S proteasome regulatory subunit N9